MGKWEDEGMGRRVKGIMRRRDNERMGGKRSVFII
jgi:hypothetical protein